LTTEEIELDLGPGLA